MVVVTETQKVVKICSELRCRWRYRVNPHILCYPPCLISRHLISYTISVDQEMPGITHTIVSIGVSHRIHCLTGEQVITNQKYQIVAKKHGRIQKCTWLSDQLCNLDLVILLSPNLKTNKQIKKLTHFLQLKIQRSCFRLSQSYPVLKLCFCN